MHCSAAATFENPLLAPLGGPHWANIPRTCLEKLDSEMQLKCTYFMRGRPSTPSPAARGIKQHLTVSPRRSCRPQLQRVPNTSGRLLFAQLTKLRQHRIHIEFMNHTALRKYRASHRPSTSARRVAIALLMKLGQTAIARRVDFLSLPGLTLHRCRYKLHLCLWCGIPCLLV